MLNNKQWIAREKEVAELEKQRKELKEQIKEISKRIHILKVDINQHNKLHKEQKVRTNSLVYEMFGKPLKDLTKEEYKIYYNTRQRINRQKRKGKEEFKMTVREFLRVGDKRKKTYRDVKDYVEIIKHEKGTEEAEKVKDKKVVDIIGINI